jgi:hypothetical protein
VLWDTADLERLAVLHAAWNAVDIEQRLTLDWLTG